MKKELLENEKQTVKAKSKKLPKEVSQEILKKIFRSLLKAIGIMLYFVVLNLAYSSIKQDRLIGDIEVFAGAFLLAGIILLEKAYKNDNGSTAINGIELLFLSLHSLTIMHVITLFKYDFRFYLLTSSYIFSIYYVFKAIVLYTKGRKSYLNSLSDISEITKKDEPIKKEAQKRNEVEEDRIDSDKENTIVENKEKTKTKKITTNSKKTDSKKTKKSSTTNTSKPKKKNSIKKENIKTSEVKKKESKKQNTDNKEQTKTKSTTKKTKKEVDKND